MMASLLTLPTEIHLMIRDYLTPPFMGSDKSSSSTAFLRPLIKALCPIPPYSNSRKEQLRNLYATALAIQLKNAVGRGMVYEQRQFSKDDRENFRVSWKREFAGEVMQVDVDLGDDIPWFWKIFFEVWYDDTRFPIPIVEGNGWPADSCCDNFGCLGDCEDPERGIMPIKPFLVPMDDESKVRRPGDLEAGLADIAAGCKMVSLVGILLARRIKKQGKISVLSDGFLVSSEYDHMLPTDFRTQLLFMQFKGRVMGWISENLNLLKSSI